MKAECEPATIDEMAAAEFQDLKAFFKMPKDDRLRNINVLIEQIRPMAILAVELLEFDKLELIAKVSADPARLSAFLTGIADAVDALEALKDIVSVAEARMVIALANIEGVRDPAAAKNA
jgi:hypothetical protein